MPQGGPMLVRGSGGGSSPSPKDDDDDSGLLDSLPSVPSTSDITDRAPSRPSVPDIDTPDIDIPSRPSRPDIDVRDVAGKFTGPKGMVADRAFDFTTDRRDDVTDGFDEVTDFLSDRRDETTDTARETGSDARDFVIDVGETATKPHRFVIDEGRSAASSAGSAASDGFDEFGSALNTVFERQASIAEQVTTMPQQMAGMISGAFEDLMDEDETDGEGGLSLPLLAVGGAVALGIVYFLFGGDN